MCSVASAAYYFCTVVCFIAVAQYGVEDALVPLAARVIATTRYYSALRLALAQALQWSGVLVAIPVEVTLVIGRSAQDDPSVKQTTPPPR